MGNAKDFVRLCLKANPNARISAEAMQQHAWLKKNIDVSDDQLDVETAKLVCQNLKRFSDASTFARMCVAVVARQLDHAKLGGIHQTFRQLDTNGDGTLSFQEVQVGFKSIFGEDSEEYRRASELFENLDLDDSQSIDYTEFCAAGLEQSILQKDEVLWLAFKAIVGEGKEGISVDQLTELLDKADVKDTWTPDVCRAVAAEVIKEFDNDKDRMIDFEDWKKLMQNCWDKQKGNDGGARVLRPTLSMGEGTMSTYDFLAKVSESKV